MNYITGALRNGKSYYSTRKIVDALLRGKIVATNGSIKAARKGLRGL